MRRGATIYPNGGVEAVDSHAKAFGLVVGCRGENPDGADIRLCSQARNARPQAKGNP